MYSIIENDEFAAVKSCGWYMEPNNRAGCKFQRNNSKLCRPLCPTIMDVIGRVPI